MRFRELYFVYGADKAMQETTADDDRRGGFHRGSGHCLFGGQGDLQGSLQFETKRSIKRTKRRPK